MIEIVTREEFHRDAVGIWILNRQHQKTLVAKPIHFEFEEHDHTYMLPEPTFSVRRIEMQSTFQSLINELVRLGYRADSDRVAGELDASKRNLEDMRHIVDKMLKILECK